ncbi:hypothetical protein [Burkholderia stagnalis]|nr:hypothetical protein [Burkholderia stagnalis]
MSTRAEYRLEVKTRLRPRTHEAMRKSELANVVEAPVKEVA